MPSSTQSSHAAVKKIVRAGLPRMKAKPQDTDAELAEQHDPAAATTTRRARHVSDHLQYARAAAEAGMCSERNDA